MAWPTEPACSAAPYRPRAARAPPLRPAAASHPRILLSGHLLKRSSGWTGDWKRRLFVLDARGELTYYRASSLLSRALSFHGSALPPRDTIIKVNYEIVPGSPGYSDTGSP